jgi:hypothetical protein
VPATAAGYSTGAQRIFRPGYESDESELVTPSGAFFGRASRIRICAAVGSIEPIGKRVAQELPIRAAFPNLAALRRRQTE